MKEFLHGTRQAVLVTVVLMLICGIIDTLIAPLLVAVGLGL